jgi:hypothetical protein
MGLIGEVWADAGLHVDSSSFAQYGAALKEAEGQVSSFTDSTKAAMATAFTLPAAAVAGIAAYGATIGASYETASIKLETLYGSQQRAREEFQWLADFAASTPFEFPELLEVDGLLKNAGLSAQEYLKGIGDASAAQGKSIEQTTEAIIDAMTGEYERLKEYGINSVEINKQNYQQLGVAAEDAGKRALIAIDKNGQQQVMVVDKNNKQMIASTILAFWNDKYAGAMEKQSQTITGMYSTIKDNIKNGLAEMAGFDMSSMTIKTGSLLGILKELSGVAVSVSGAFSNMSEPMQTFVIVAAVGVASVGLLAAGLMLYSTASAAYTAVTGLMITETLTLGAAISAAIWPATLIVGTLALVAAGLVYLEEKTGLVSAAWQTLKDVFTIAADYVGQVIGWLHDWIAQKIDGIKTALDDMIPDSFVSGVTTIWNTVTSVIGGAGDTIHQKAEGIRQDHNNVGSSAQTAGSQVTTATGQMVGGFNAAGGASTAMGGDVAGTVPAVNSLTGAAYSGVAANKSYAASFVNVSNMASEAASAAISAANRIGAAIKTSIAQVGELESLAGKWNTRAKLGITSSGGSGTGEGNVKVKTPANMMTASEVKSRQANNVVYNNNVKIQNNYEASKSSTASVKRATGG